MTGSGRRGGMPVTTCTELLWLLCWSGISTLQLTFTHCIPIGLSLVFISRLFLGSGTLKRPPYIRPSAWMRS